MCQISADNRNKQDGVKEDLLILQYNLDGKLKKQYQDMCQDGTNILCLYLPTENIYELSPPYSGTEK